MTDAFDIVEVQSLDCRFEPRPWPFAEREAAAIDAHWARLRAEKPQLYNGRVLIQHHGALRERGDAKVFEAAYLETDFKAFLAWRDFGHPDPGVRNGFGMAALRAADGAWLLGEMAPHTANAGRVYFPSGTPDPSDIRGGQVDIEGSIARELAEETGLDPATCTIQAGCTVVMDRLRVGFFKEVVTPEPAEAAVARIRATLATHHEPELSAIHIVRSPADIGPAVIPVVRAYLQRLMG